MSVPSRGATPKRRQARSSSNSSAKQRDSARRPRARGREVASTDGKAAHREVKDSASGRMPGRRDATSGRNRQVPTYSATGRDRSVATEGTDGQPGSRRANCRQPVLGAPDTTQGRSVGIAWERQPEESAVAYEAFAAYRDAGEKRTLKDAAERVGKSLSLVKRWSAGYHWRLRADAYDRAQQRTARETQQQLQEDAYARRLEHAAQLEKIAMAGLRTLLVRDTDTGELRFDARLKPTDVAALIRAACQLLPTALPEPELPQDSEIDHSDISTDDLRRLVARVSMDEEGEKNAESDQKTEEMD